MANTSNYNRKVRFVSETDPVDDLTQIESPPPEKRAFIEDLHSKRNRICITETDMQCDDDDANFVENSQTYDDTWISDEIISKKKITKDNATNAEKTITGDNSTSTEPVRENELISSTVDIHGCKYFGQFVCNELLRFNIHERYIVMQNIIEVLKQSTE